MSNRIVSICAEYGYYQMMAHLTELHKAYPFIRISFIGETVLGKPIPAVSIGNGSRQIHYNASFHANEWITTLLVMFFIEEYASSIQLDEQILDKRGKELFRETTLFVVPMVNPDGVELVHTGASHEHAFSELLHQWNQGSNDFSQWKANIRGVDLNDQFPAHWEEERERRSPEGPGPRDYVGTAPLTEPEAIALYQFTKQHAFSLVVALHTQGREIYWNYRDYEPVQALSIAEQLAAISGFEAIKLNDSDAGYKDWFIQEFRKPGFTIEAGIGCNPLPLSNFPVIYQEVLPIMVRGLYIYCE